MRKPFNDRGTTCTVNGHTATRTRRAGSPAAKRSARTIKRETQFDTVVQMTSERVSQPDIARALGVTQGRVSQILKDAREMTLPYRMRAIEDARAMALMETNHYAAAWAKRAKSSPRAAEVMLSWLARSDKIQGLYQQHTSLSLDSTRSENDPKPDYSRLDDDELATLERLMQKACGIEPPPEPVYEPVIPDWAKAAPPQALAQIEDLSSIIATIDREETRREKILRLHREGMTASAIIETLAITHEQFIAALEGPTTPGASMQ